MLSSRIKVGALFILLVVALTGKAQNRIIGGNITDISNRPYQVAVFVDNQFEGGGVIVNRQWIITAAHVVYGNNAGEIKFVAGQNDISGMPPALTVSQVIVNPNYNGSPQYDIALLKLTSPLVYTDKIQPIERSKSITYSNGITGTVSGWGYITTQFTPDLTHLRQVSMPITSSSSSSIVTGSSTKTPFKGDSGGPLTIMSGTKTILVGIVHGSANKVNTNDGASYANIGFLYNWIQSNTCSLSGSDCIAQNSVATYTCSADCNFELSPNLEEVSRTGNSITVRAKYNGSGFVKAEIDSINTISKSLWVGVPIVFGVNYNGGMLSVSTPSEAKVTYTEWSINGNRYTTYGTFLYLSSYPSGNANVTVRARNECGYSSYYSTQIYFDGGNMHLVYNKTSDQIQIKSADSSAPISAKQENTIKYVIFNSNNGTVASQGVLPSGSNTIDCGKLRNGLYTVTVICGGKKTSKTFIK